MCVQSFDDSLDSAVRITYRISLRSSSLWEPRHPLLKVVFGITTAHRLSEGFYAPQLHTFSRAAFLGQTAFGLKV